MSVLTLRLPDIIEAQLDFFAKREQTTKSALGRLALEVFIAQKQREVELETMVQAVNTMNKTPEILSEMVAMNQDFYPTESEGQAFLLAPESAAAWWK
jgi:hypothetical protein